MSMRLRLCSCGCTSLEVGILIFFFFTEVGYHDSIDLFHNLNSYLRLGCSLLRLVRS